MFLFDKKSDVKLNNKGYSLIELLVVMAIISILVGGVAVSASLVYSRDAYKAAKKIDDMLTETRMLAMSRSGDYSLEVKKVGNEFISKIGIINASGVLCDDGGNQIPDDAAIPIGKNITIYDANSVTSVEITSVVGTGFRITYGSKGNATGVGPSIQDGCYKLKVVANRNSKEATINIAKLTGRHFIEGE